MKRFLLAVFVFVFSSFAAASFVNDNIHRSVEFTGTLVREKRAIAVLLADEKQVENRYFLAVEMQPLKAPNGSVSSISAKEKSSEKALVVERLSAAEEKKLLAAVQSKSDR
jgi:hypothetical protein